VRLVTIVGPGGIGKTRLGIACAARQLAVKEESETYPYKDGIFFVDLAPLAEAERLVFSLAETLNLRTQACAREKRSPKQQLLDSIQSRSLLLVLDNFEQLLYPLQHLEEHEVVDGATLIADILGTAPEVRILVTSRERLNLQVEQVYPIQGLAFPSCEIPEGAAEYSALKLFLQSAQSVQPNLTWTPGDLSHMTQVCRLVEGMPLGLELAASWVDTLSVQDIAVELKQGLDLLESELRDVPERQRSVRASIDYSWQKLDEKERFVFSKLSIFRGGFTREAAQAVTGATLRQLSRLVNKSFIQFRQQRDRYQIHELLRQYGAEHLDHEPELKSNLQNRHSVYYCQFLADLTDDQKGASQPQALVAFEADIENVRLAWNRAIARQDLEAIGISAESLFRFYWNNGWYLQGVKEFEKAVARLRTAEPVGEPGLILGGLLAFLGRLYAEVGPTRALC
jgi:predicted ATPase